MADIKTKDSRKGTIKAIDKAAIATQRMKKTYLLAQEKGKQAIGSESDLANNDAYDQVENTARETAHDGVCAFDRVGRKGLKTTKENLRKTKEGISDINRKRTQQALKDQTLRKRKQTTGSRIEKSIKESSVSSGKKTIKRAGKDGVKTSKRTIKTAGQSAKTAVKSGRESIKTAQRSAKAAAKTSQKALQSAKAASKAAAKTLKTAAKVLIKIIKGMIAALKSLISAIIAGGWVAAAVIILLCLFGLLAGSVYGIFFSGEDSGTGMTIRTAITEINEDYDGRLEEVKNTYPHDVLEMSGSRALWRDVLAVYAVKVNTDSENPLEVATVDENKKTLLSSIFWQMHEIDSRTETKTHIEVKTSDDGHGNIVETEKSVTETFLYITVSHKSVDEMSEMYGFDAKQKDFLAELLKDENNPIWSQVLYGIGYSDRQIVSIALSQVGNVGGEPYWSWYGFSSRVEWCACFVSWCANECGYIDAGIIPKYAGCGTGSRWFIERGQWADRNYEPAPGTIIFFDWEGDGSPDHTGIVEKCENGVVYTIEGNSSDACRTREYPVGSGDIYGYGIAAY